MKKWFLLLLLIFALGALAACGGNDDPDPTPAPTPEAQQQDDTIQDDPPATDTDGDTPASWLTPERVTINVATGLAPGWAHPAEGSFFAWLEEYTNIEVNWNAHLAAEWTEQFPLMMAGGDLPDVFLGTGPWSTMANILMYGMDLGVYMPLNDLIDNHAPNFVRRGEYNMPGLLNMLTAPDGNIYTLPTIHAFTDARVHNMVAINQTWLDTLELETPRTIDEFEATLIAFRDGDPNGDGQPVVPLSFNFNCWGAANHSPWFALFGAPLDTNFRLIKDGQITFQGAEEYFRDTARWLASLYDQGLIDLEAFTHDQASHFARAAGGDNPTFGVWSAWNPIDSAGPHGHHYVPLDPIYGPAGPSVLWNQTVAFTFGTFTMTAQANNPELIMQWVDIFYRDLYTSLTANQGPGPGEGLAWYINDAGQIARPDPLPDNMTRGQNEHPFAPGISGREYVERMAVPANPDIKLEQIDNVLVNYAGNFMDGTWDRWPTVAFMEADESDEIAFIEADLLPFVRQSLARWISGEGDVDAEWEQYLRDLDAFGLQRWLTIMQAVHERG